MPPETLPIDRKPCSSEPLVGVLWREPPTTPSNGSPLSCRGPLSDIRRPFSVGGQKDWKRGNYWDTATAMQTNGNGNSYPHSDFVNSMDNLQSNDQHAKNSGGQRLEKGTSLGSSLDWKPLKWTRSGSLCSRGFIDSKTEGQVGNSVPLQSTSGDTGPSLTPRTPDDATSRKKARLGWGEGLAKYEKKKVDPDDFVDKEAGVRDGSVDGVSSSEQLLPSPSSLPGKSPTLTGFSECASPTTPCSFACSSSPGLEEKTSITPVTVDNDVCNPTIASCHLSQNNTFNLENLENTEGFNFSSSLDELLQTDDTDGPGSSFVMDKLQVWKADISRTLEITETEIDSLENELKSLVSDIGASPASISLPEEQNNKSTKEICMEKSDGLLDNSKEDSPGTSTSKFVDMNITSEKAECSKDHASKVASFCHDSVVLEKLNESDREKSSGNGIVIKNCKEEDNIELVILDKLVQTSVLFGDGELDNQIVAVVKLMMVDNGYAKGKHGEKFAQKSFAPQRIMELYRVCGVELVESLWYSPCDYECESVLAKRKKIIVKFDIWKWPSRKKKKKRLL